MNLDQAKLAASYRVTGTEFSFRQLCVLMLIFQNDKPLRLHDVACKLKMPKPSVSRAFDGLCILGFLRRHRDPKDRRECYGIITADGERILERLA